MSVSWWETRRGFAYEGCSLFLTFSVILVLFGMHVCVCDVGVLAMIMQCGSMCMLLCVFVCCVWFRAAGLGGPGRKRDACSFDLSGVLFVPRDVCVCMCRVW